MWRQIRGMGLSYDYSMRCTPESGQLAFNLFESSQLVEAYKVARQIMVTSVGNYLCVCNIANEYMNSELEIIC